MHELEVLAVGKKMTAAAMEVEVEVDPQQQQDEGEGIFAGAEAVVDLMVVVVDEGDRFEEDEDEDPMRILQEGVVPIITTTIPIITTTCRHPPLGGGEEAIMEAIMPISVEPLWIAAVATKVEKSYQFVRQRQQPRQLLKEDRKTAPTLKDEEGGDRYRMKDKDEAEEAGSSILLWEAVMAIETAVVAEEVGDALILNGVVEEQHDPVIREEVVVVEMMAQEILKVVVLEVTGCLLVVMVGCHRKAALLVVDGQEEVGVVVIRQLIDSTHLGKSSKTFLQEKIVSQSEDETNYHHSVHPTTRTRE
jgi:hypothetical protein